VTLNGTDENPFLRYGMSRNPFPAIPKVELSDANELLADLAARPIRDLADLRERMIGRASQEFIELCTERFRKGRTISFVVSFEEDS
jgi:hypothetical protein